MKGGCFFMEQWRDIEGYEGLYQISNYGNVLSVVFGSKNHPRLKQESRLLRLAASSSGYYHVQLYKNGVPSTRLVHKLVASAFISNPEKKPEVNHKDGDKSNNRVENLEWVTKSENLKHAALTGLRVSPMIGMTGERNPFSKPILQYDLDGNFIKKWASAMEASRHMHVAPCGIYSCLSGRSATSRGYIWKRFDGIIKPQINPSTRTKRQETSCKKSLHKCRNKTILGNVQQIAHDGTVVHTWDNCSEAARCLGIPKQNIYACVHGATKHCRGYSWRLANEANLILPASLPVAPSVSAED